MIATGHTYELLHVEARTGAVIEPLPIASLNYVDELNAAGSIRAEIPANVPGITSDSLWTGGSGLVVLRDGDPVWGGFLWAADADLDANKVSLSGTGYFSHYENVHLDRGYNGNNSKVNQSWHLRNWIEYANSNGGIDTDTRYINTDAVSTRRSWDVSEFKSIGDAIEEIAEDDRGFNFRIMPFWMNRGKLVGNRFVRTSRGGSVVPFRLVHKQTCNVKKVTYDSASLATHAYALGAQDKSGRRPIESATNAGLYARMPRKNVVKSYTDAKDRHTLRSKAASLASAGKTPIAVPSLTLYPDLDPFAFSPGDTGTVYVQQGYVRVNDDFVITSRSISVDTAGREETSLSLANKEVYGIGESE
ncbi:hypothetical protein [Streptomyces cacaoi]|uniref:DUF5047 domain-containing protein n=1 Tax=Streptomyces cacaoi TaxID=1898 RepID=A0A4Y3QZ35_STRCI|nr:hypothetical protein [Streptomyces cacaoi]GEB50452.1 hypothetical protein SCA03_30030 [Streptomyces cacaoi]